MYLLPVVLLILASKDFLQPASPSHAGSNGAKGEILSILIPVRNGESTIGYTLQSAVELSFAGRKEIIVVDDGSTDRTVQICRSWRVDKIVYEHAEGNKKDTPRGKAWALNRGLRECSGSLILVLDADTTVPRDLIKDVSPFLSDTKVGGVSFPVVAEEPRNLIQSLQNIEYAMMATMKRACNTLGTTLAMSGCAMLLKRGALEAIGGFPDGLTEDVELSLRMIEKGFTLAYCGSFSSAVRTKTPSELRSLLVQKYRWMSGSFESYLRHLRLLFSIPSGWLMIWSYFVYAFCVLGFLVHRSLAFLAPLIGIFLGTKVSPFTGIILLLARLTLPSESFRFIVPGVSLVYAQYLVGSNQSQGRKIQLRESLLLAPYVLFYLPMLFVVTCAGIIGAVARRTRTKTSKR